MTDPGAISPKEEKRRAVKQELVSGIVQDSQSMESVTPSIDSCGSENERSKPTPCNHYYASPETMLLSIEQWLSCIRSITPILLGIDPMGMKDDHGDEKQLAVKDNQAQVLQLMHDILLVKCCETNNTGAPTGLDSATGDILKETGFTAQKKQQSKTVICPQCGKAFSPTAKTKPRRFCSDACRQAWWTKNRDQKKHSTYYTFTCAHCGKTFISFEQKHRKFCSHACYIAERFGGKTHDKRKV